MIEFLAALALALAPVSAAPQAPGKGDENDGRVGVRADDPEMNAAIAQGRAGLPEFYRRLASPR